MAYATGPYQLFTSLPVPNRPKVSTSRKIDFAVGDYVTDDDGGFEKMPSTAQRVMLLCCFASDPKRKFITPADQSAEEKRIRRALEVMTKGESPEIKIVSLSVGNPTQGVASTDLTFTDLTTGLDTTVQL